MICGHPLGFQFPSFDLSWGFLGCCAIPILEPFWNILRTIRVSSSFISDSRRWKAYKIKDSSLFLRILGAWTCIAFITEIETTPHAIDDNLKFLHSLCLIGFKWFRVVVPNFLSIIFQYNLMFPSSCQHNLISSTNRPKEKLLFTW